jgi:hypothetical protein
MNENDRFSNYVSDQLKRKFEDIYISNNQEDITIKENGINNNHIRLLKENDYGIKIIRKEEGKNNGGNVLNNLNVCQDLRERGRDFWKKEMIGHSNYRNNIVKESLQIDPYSEKETVTKFYIEHNSKLNKMFFGN